MKKNKLVIALATAAAAAVIVPAIAFAADGGTVISPANTPAATTAAPEGTVAITTDGSNINVGGKSISPAATSGQVELKQAADGSISISAAN
ncbi:MAG: hypothetical protein LBN08_06105 [Lactobacillales bacterium]|nr:hypothetical protein [Lactobacillales bacterium]